MAEKRPSGSLYSFGFTSTKRAKNEMNEDEELVSLYTNTMNNGSLSRQNSIDISDDIIQSSQEPNQTKVATHSSHSVVAYASEVSTSNITISTTRLTALQEAEQLEDLIDTDSDVIPCTPEPELEDEYSDAIVESLLESVALETTSSATFELKLLSSTEATSLFDGNNASLTTPPKPYPDTFEDSWCDYYLKLPCSAKSKYPNPDSLAQDKFVSRWSLVQVALRRNIKSSYELEEAIMSYNFLQRRYWKFDALHELFSEELSSDETASFFSNILPKMCELALALPQLTTQPIPLLSAGKNRAVSMTQHQAASLLANCFFCTFPRRKANKSTTGGEYSTYPAVNFSTLFGFKKEHREQRAPKQREFAKLKCIINYFRRVTKETPVGVLTFLRQVLQPDLAWSLCDSPLTECEVRQKGSIESATGLLQMDFANKYVGGGVLRGGCVQEEIRFLVCPELITSMLFTERLEDNEVLFVTGAEQYSTYTGYGNQFLWEADHVDTTPLDSWRRRDVTVVAADATCHLRRLLQYGRNCLDRELLKAAVAFYDESPDGLAAVATGNWGCGAFRGDVEHKFLIQLMAAAACRRAVRYYSYDQTAVGASLTKMHELLRFRDVRVREIYQLLLQYNQLCVVQSKSLGVEPESVFEFVKRQLLQSNSLV